MKEQMALLVAFAEALSAKQSHELEWLARAAYGAGASRDDLLTAVDKGRLLGDPPEPVGTEAYATVRAWQWMASYGTAPSDESAPRTGRRCTERRKVWIPCTTK